MPELELFAIEAVMDKLPIALTDAERETIREAVREEIKNALAQERMSRLAVEPEETLRALVELEELVPAERVAVQLTLEARLRELPPHVCALAALLDRARGLEQLDGPSDEQARELRSAVVALASRYDAVERGR